MGDFVYFLWIHGELMVWHFFVRFSMDKLWYLDQMFRVLSLVRGAVLQYSYYSY